MRKDQAESNYANPAVFQTEIFAPLPGMVCGCLPTALCPALQSFVPFAVCGRGLEVEEYLNSL